MEENRKPGREVCAIILLFRRLRREDSEFEDSLSYMVWLCSPPPKKSDSGEGVFIYDPSSEIQLWLEFSKNGYS